MISQVRLAALIGLWAVITWGGRIGLLAGDETLLAKARIGVSLGVALVAVVGLVARSRWVRIGVALYTVVTVLVWSTSVVSVTGDAGSSTQFKLVHLALAAVSIAIAALAWMSVVRPSGPGQARPSGERPQAGL
ncbi:MAG TPA: hypothetical protein VIW46_04510 [Acidimicrobiia bacterium]|jgi:hypothetical protein